MVIQLNFNHPFQVPLAFGLPYPIGLARPYPFIPEN